ncbi:MAG: glycosyltransferase family 2 protein [Proteobacteria bacterium]|nr:glycosyltransferase family 2 protein [Pseudomonadota bacterium]
MQRRLLSIVVPAYNEEDNLELLCREVARHASRTNCNWELILVDDGSTDRSPEIMRTLVVEEPRIRFLQLSRNFGQQAAICAGLDAARGDLIMVMDADLQDPPEKIPDFVTTIDQGYDLVFGIRQARRDPLLTRLNSKIFWWTIRRLSGFNIPPNLAVMRIFNRRFLTEFQRFPERQKFIEGIFMWIGMRRTTLAIPHRPRHAGVSKYNLLRKLSLAVNGITAFSDKPLTLAISVGVLASVSGLGFLSYISVREILFDTYAQGWVSQFGVVLLVGGVQMIFLGVVGKYVSRLFNEVKQRPTYIVQDRSQDGSHDQSHDQSTDNYGTTSGSNANSDGSTSQSASG